MTRPKRRPGTIRVPGIVAAGIRRAERVRKAEIIAAPIRDMMGMLQRGECYEADGYAIMRLPNPDDADAEWAAIGPALEGWIELWHKIAPQLGQYKLGVVADRFQRALEVTPALARGH